MPLYSSVMSTVGGEVKVVGLQSAVGTKLHRTGLAFEKGDTNCSRMRIFAASAEITFRFITSVDKAPAGICG